MTIFTNASSISIPASHTLGPSLPYPSSINVSGLAGVTTKVTVTLNGFTHTFPDDVDILLVSPTGQTATILSDVGAASDVTGLTITLDDAAASFLPDSGLLTSGTFLPTNQGGSDPFPAPAPSGSALSALATFNGFNPNGDWSLYIVDDFPGDVGSLTGGWSLDITTPPVVTIAAADSTAAEAFTRSWHIHNYPHR
jgi:subtilisin-like proprotein convertase family protein